MPNTSKTWVAIDRAKRFHRGQCRDCWRPRGTEKRPDAACCFVCYAKAYQRRPNALAALNASKGIRFYRPDRRHYRAKMTDNDYNFGISPYRGEA